jgi:hypothetical protein
MSAYALQKLIRDVNRDPATRESFFKDPGQIIAMYDLTEAEKDALVRRDYRALYALGVHGLLLRPFSILHSVSEKDYLESIRRKI